MKILLAVDWCVESELAVKAVAGRPWPPNTTVEVLSVVMPPASTGFALVTESLRQRAESAVQAAALYLRSSGIEANPLVRTGTPRGVIVDRAAELRADLLVIGAHRAHMDSEFLHGSVARAVVRFAPCSVEVVRNELGPLPLKILLATDGSHYSELAARSVAERPWPAGTEVRILSVADHGVLLYEIGDRRHFEAGALEALEQHAATEAEEAVASAEKIILTGNLPCSATVARPSSTPQYLILEEAKTWDASLIVLGVHGQIGLTRLLLGSVSEAVAMNAPCSVEVIRPSSH